MYRKDGRCEVCHSPNGCRWAGRGFDFPYPEGWYGGFSLIAARMHLIPQSSRCGRQSHCRPFPSMQKIAFFRWKKAGDNQLLLARTEQDALILELYDTKGKLLNRLETGVKVSEYKIDFVNMLQRADGLVLWLNLSKTFQEDEDGTVHQRVEGTKCFVVQGEIHCTDCDRWQVRNM